MDSPRRGQPVSGEQELIQLVAEHQQSLWRYLRYLGCDLARAEDLLQETFLAVWQKPFEQSSHDATRRYLRTVARHRFLMALRRDRVRLQFHRIDEADAAWSAWSPDDGEAYRQALRECLGTLPDRARQVLHLHYHEGRSRQEIGALLGATVDGVKTLMRRSRERLRDCIRRRIEP